MNRIQMVMAVITGISIIFACCGASLNNGSSPGEHEEGLAVYYSDKFHGRKTANGELYDKNKLTAAHRTLPFGTILRVTNLRNRRSLELRINDRGPFNNRKRIIDISRKAAEKLGMIQAGVARVRVEIVSIPKKKK